MKMISARKHPHAYFSKHFRTQSQKQFAVCKFFKERVFFSYFSNVSFLSTAKCQAVIDYLILEK